MEERDNIADGKGIEAVGRALASVPEELEVPRADTPPGRILRSAREIFAEKGLEGLTMREVARRAEVNLALINYYFGSKEELVQRMIRGELLEMQRDVFALLDPGLEAPARFIQLPLSVVEVLRCDPVRMRLIRRVLAGSPQRISRAIDELGPHGVSGASRVIAGMIEESREAGRVTDADPRSILLYLISAAYGLVIIEPLALSLTGFRLDDDEAWHSHKAALEKLLEGGLAGTEREEER